MLSMSYVRSRVRTRTHGSVGRRELRLPLTRLISGLHTDKPLQPAQKNFPAPLKNGVDVGQTTQSKTNIVVAVVR